MLHRQVDILTVGDVTTDAFIRLKDASVHGKVDHDECELCMSFGSKIPFEYVKVVKAVGNAANAAVAASKLGLRVGIVTNIGDDQNGHDCLKELETNKVITSHIKVHKNKATNYHFVLWYEVDRTILVNHIEYDYKLPRIETPKWLYLTSLASHTEAYHSEIIDFLEKNPKVKLAFQPGTFQITLGLHEIQKIYKRASVLIVNLEEAMRMLNIDGRYLPALIEHEKYIQESSLEKEISKTKLDIKKSDKPNIKSLLKALAEHGPELVIITDNTNGAFMFDGDNYYHMPMYPDPRPAFERTGCGDAFAATFVAALAKGKTPLEALTWAPVNPMSVAQFIGAQEGLLSLDQLEWWLERAPEEYRPREI